MEYTKPEAMRLAKADYYAGRLDGLGYTYEVWGGTTKYTATREGIYRFMRDDNGGTRGIARHSLLVLPASRLDKQSHAL